jgi:hypothetical protein
MAFPNLVSARAAQALSLLAALALVAATGCQSNSAGGRYRDAAVDMPVETMQKLPPPDADCPTDAQGPPGQCPVVFCGMPKSVAALASGETAQLGSDRICTPGYVCVPDAPTASGAALVLRCVQARASSSAFGAACTKGDAGTATGCANDALCVEAAAAPGQPFCSALCASDADCPTDGYCLESKSATLPNGSYVYLGYCTPKSKITGTICVRESDCPADQGCVSYGARTHLLTCVKSGGNKSTGDKCTKSSECRSGQCLDREFHADANRSFCSAECGKSSDCGADQRCARVVLNNNGTVSDPRDDLVVGICQTLFVPVANAGCQSSADCTKNGADTCSTKYGLCYKAGAPSGSACTDDVGCELGAVCSGPPQNPDPRFPGGYCQTYGCAPGAAAGSVDSCPGADSTCVQRGPDEPIKACYEGCAKSADCSRTQQLYACEAQSTVATGSGGDAGAGDAGTGDAGTGDSGTDAGAATGDGAATDAGQLPSICIFNQGV